MKTFNNINEFNIASENIEAIMVESSNAFANHVTDAINYFCGTGNWNPAILRRVIRMAYNARGYNAAKLVKYLSHATGFSIVADKENKGDKTLGKKEKKEIDSVSVLAFLALNPDWSKYKYESDKEKDSIEVPEQVLLAAMAFIKAAKDTKPDSLNKLLATAMAKAKAAE